MYEYSLNGADTMVHSYRSLYVPLNIGCNFLRAEWKRSHGGMEWYTGVRNGKKDVRNVIEME